MITKHSYKSWHLLCAYGVQYWTASRSGVIFTTLQSDCCYWCPHGKAQSGTKGRCGKSDWVTTMLCRFAHYPWLPQALSVQPRDRGLSSLGRKKPQSRDASCSCSRGLPGIGSLQLYWHTCSPRKPQQDIWAFCCVVRKTQGRALKSGHIGEKSWSWLSKRKTKE